MIAVVGSLNVDLVVPVERFPRPGETLLGGAYTRHAGGKGANQAVAAARAGGRVRMVGRVGADAFGAALVDGLRADGVDTTHIAHLEGVPTGTAFISVDATGQNCIIVSSGANGALAAADLPRGAFAGAQVVLLQLEVPLETTLEAARLGRSVGATVVLNLAPAIALDPEALGDVDVLVVNESEAALLLGADDARATEAEPETTARHLTRWTATVVLTLGAQGAAWANRDGNVGTVAGHPVDVVDTTAAGDAFVGALAARLAAGARIDAAVRWANAAGALATTAHGAQTSLPTHDAIAALVASRAT